VKINNIKGKTLLHSTKCLPAIGKDRFEEKWEKLLLKTISMLFNSIDTLDIRFMVR
jgi:hypothetical protein